MRNIVPRLLPRTVRGRVAAVLNGTLLILFVLFLVYDYRNDSADRLNLKCTSLEEQAKILAPGVGGQMPEDIPRYLAATRRQMDDTHEDTHVVAAEVEGRFYQSGAPQEGGDAIAERLRAAGRSGSSFLDIGGRVFMVGRHQEGATIVYVAEDLRDVRMAIRADLGRHLVAVGLALLCGIVIINATLWLAFQRPLSVLTGAVAQIGSGKLGVQIERIGAIEFDVLATAINGMSQALADVERARSVQMRKARAIQDSLHPTRLQLAGVAISHHFQPTEAVAGDYYDLLVLPDGSGLFCIADVTGHGVSAALVAAMTKVCLLNAVEHSLEPGEILGFVNRRLSAMDLPEMFVSMLLVRIRQESSALEFAGAGHPAGILVDESRRLRELKSEGPVLGIGEDFSWTTQRETFSSGHRLLLFTDGVTEASGGEHGLFGLPRLQECFLAVQNVAPAQAVQIIVQRVAEFCKSSSFPDDFTLVLAERLAAWPL